jgi:hypothetical protein
MMQVNDMAMMDGREKTQRSQKRRSGFSLARRAAGSPALFRRSTPHFQFCAFCVAKRIVFLTLKSLPAAKARQNRARRTSLAHMKRLIGVGKTTG